MVRPIPLELEDGKTRLLYFSAEGMMLVEKEYLGGRPITDLIGAPWSASVALHLLWGALVWEDPSLTLAGAQAIYNQYHNRTGENHFDLKPALLKAYFAAIISARPKPNGHDPKALTEAGSPAPSPSGSGE